jgi:hypothetical protein
MVAIKHSNDYSIKTAELRHKKSYLLIQPQQALNITNTWASSNPTHPESRFTP